MTKNNNNVPTRDNDGIDDFDDDDDDDDWAMPGQSQ